MHIVVSVDRINDGVVKRIPLGARVDSALANIVKAEAAKREIPVSTLIEQAFAQKVSAGAEIEMIV